MDEVLVLPVLVLGALEAFEARISWGTSSMSISDGSLSESLTSSTRGFMVATVAGRWGCSGAVTPACLAAQRWFLEVSCRRSGDVGKVRLAEGIQQAGATNTAQQWVDVGSRSPARLHVSAQAGRRATSSSPLGSTSTVAHFQRRPPSH